MMIWVIHYDGKPLNSSKLSSPSRKIRAYETEAIAWKSATRLFSDRPISEFNRVSVVPYVCNYKIEEELNKFKAATEALNDFMKTITSKIKRSDRG